MSVLATPLGSPTPSRRERAGRVAGAALRAGVIAAVVAAVAWLLASAIAGTVFLVLVAASILLAVATLLDRVVPTAWWIARSVRSARSVRTWPRRCSGW